MQFDTDSLQTLEEALGQLDIAFAHLSHAAPSYDPHAIRRVLLDTAARLKDNYPYFHPFYAGQMLKPPHPVARLAYMLALWINPNNHALDGGRASSYMEKEAVAQIAHLFGWLDSLGHLCGGGTMANLEALWAAGQLRPGELVVASEQPHYTHSRISEVLKLPFQPVACDDAARMDPQALERVLKESSVGTVVATMGSTGTGSVDPLPQILELREKYGFRVHADAAYGGYFVLADSLPEHTVNALQQLGAVDSIAIDPHKHGLQPYGCGCILFKDPGVGALYKHDSPCTYFTSSELHLGEISLECSRAGASAVALWATQQLLPLVRGGEFASSLSQCRRAAQALYQRLASDARFVPLFEPELDIVAWAPGARTIRKVSALSRALFQAAARRNLHLALFSYPTRLLGEFWQGVDLDEEYVTCLRSCLMKPEHLAWMDRIWQVLDEAMQEVGREA